MPGPGQVKSAIQPKHDPAAVFIEQTNNPAVPPSGFAKLFVKDDNFLYYMNDQGRVIGLIDEGHLFVLDSSLNQVQDSTPEDVVVDLN